MFLRQIRQPLPVNLVLSLKRPGVYRRRAEISFPLCLALSKVLILAVFCGKSFRPFLLFTVASLFQAALNCVLNILRPGQEGLSLEYLGRPVASWPACTPRPASGHSAIPPPAREPPSMLSGIPGAARQQAIPGHRLCQGCIPLAPVAPQKAFR